MLPVTARIRVLAGTRRVHFGIGGHARARATSRGTTQGGPTAQNGAPERQDEVQWPRPRRGRAGVAARVPAAAPGSGTPVQDGYPPGEGGCRPRVTGTVCFLPSR